MVKNHGSSPFLFPSTIGFFPSGASESTAPSSPSSSPPPSPCSSGSDSSFNSPYKSLSSLSRPSHSSSSHFQPPAALGPCAACKFHGRDCSENCYLASFFPPNDVHKFAAVASVFGSGNVHNFLQQNSNSSYIPLLLLLRDTTQEDGELYSDSKKNTLSETNIHNQLGESMDSDHIRELIQGRELAKQLKKHLSSESSDIIIDLVQRILSSFEKSLSIPNLSCSTSQLQNDVSLAVPTSNGDPTKSPTYMDDSPATVNFDAVLNPAAKRRKTLPRCTYEVRFNSEHPLDDGYSWRKYGHKDILGAKYPRTYYRCNYKSSLNCLAMKQIQRSDEDPSTFKITYRGVHTCSKVKPQPQASPEEQKDRQNNQYQVAQEAPFNFQPSTNSIEILPMPYVSDSTFRDKWLEVSKWVITHLSTRIRERKKV